MFEDALKLANEWWLTGNISKEKAKPYHRAIFTKLKELLRYRQIVVLTGLRRVGKSTLMFQLINDLLNKVDKRHILYFNFDEKAVEPLEVLKLYGKITGVDWKKEKCYIFFDEIQKIKDWSSKIKFLYDNLPNLKFFISGSASLMIEKEAISNLAGRYFLQEIEPLSIKEFAELYLGKKIDRLELYRDELERLFPHWMKRPFPEIVRWKDERKVYEYVREMIIDRAIKIDLPSLFKVRMPLLLTLTEIFFSDPGMTLNLTSLAKDLKVNKLVLEEHIYFLEFAKIIKLIKNFRPSIRAESRKMKKVYPSHIALSFPYYPSLDKGKIFESLIASLDIKNYWRNGFREIDFVKKVQQKLLPIEVKAKDIITKEDVKNLIYFMKKYSVSNGIIIYTGKSKEEKINSLKIKFINIIDFLFHADMFMNY